MNRPSMEARVWVWVYVSESERMILHPFLNRDMQLPNYSEKGEVKKHPAFHMTTGGGGEERPPQVELPPDTMLITHVSCIASVNSQCRL